MEIGDFRVTQWAVWRCCPVILGLKSSWAGFTAMWLPVSGPSHPVPAGAFTCSRTIRTSKFDFQEAGATGSSPCDMPAPTGGSE